ncbi:MAG: glycosyltransferase family 39 protein [Verrucomicrobiales bacterium]
MRFWSPARVVSLVLFLIAAVGFLQLRFLDKPWKAGVQARQEANQVVRVKDYAVSGIYWATLGNACALLVLALTTGLWYRTRKVESEMTEATDSGTFPKPSGNLAWLLPARTLSHRWWHERMGRSTSGSTKPTWFVGLLAVVALGGTLRFDGLDKTLWNDEEYTLRRYVWGYHAPDAEHQRLEFHPVSWEQTFYGNRGANNHVLFSVLARLSLDGWRLVTGESYDRFSEVAYRLPSFFAGLATIGILALLLRSLNLPVTGLAAATFLSLHPWHIRYSTEARGYALAMLLILVAMYLAVLAMRHRRWRYWLGFGVAQAGFMLAFPGALYVAVILNAMVGLWLSIRSRARRFSDLFQEASPWLVAGLMSVMLFVQAYAPSIPQVRLYLERDIALGSMGLGWFQDVGAHLLLGVPVKTDGTPTEALGQSLERISESFPLFTLWLWVFVPFLLLRGVWGFARRGALPLTLALILPGALLLAFLHNNLGGNFVFSWYLVYGSMAVALLFGSAYVQGSCFAEACGRNLRSRVLHYLTLVGLFGWAYASMQALPPSGAMRQPFELAAAQARPYADRYDAASGRDIMTASFGTSEAMMRTYDPWVHPIEEDEPAQMRALLDEAKQQDRSFYVYVCGINRARVRHPELLSLVRDEALFEPVAYVAGLEAYFSFQIYRAR